MTRIIDLDQSWTLRAVGGDIPVHLAGMSIPATVPGCVHLDLLAAGLIPDPHLDENERLLAWIGRTDWRYETTFAWDGDETDQVDLVALGLDTVATVELNGVELGRTRNMHRSYRFPVADLLRPVNNSLVVTFTGAMTAAEQASRELGDRPRTNPPPYNAIRKMACDYGWDWGPQIATVGIWRPLRLHAWSEARIATVRPLALLDGSTGLVQVHVDVCRAPADDGPLGVEVVVGEVRVPATLAAGESSTMVEVRITDVRRWWPRGYGDQPRYRVSVRLHGERDTLEEWWGRVGFRTVEVDTNPDQHGTPFTFVVNGKPVFARGVNWIPDDSFPSRITRDRYARRLTQARDANVNLVRVWGGGLYESDDFYEVCDELGLLVWQDFPFACAAYAEESPLRDEVEGEAREAVTRLCPHPSLVLWNGNNENIWGYHDWGWPEELAGKSWGWGYYTEVLPRIVAELDPTRPYIPGSPYSLDPGRHPNLAEHGTMHIWDVWNQRDYTAYRDHAPRFVSEFGFQGPPAWATLTRAVHDEPMAADSPGVLSHQKAGDGNGKLARGLAAHVPAPTTFADWHWACSLNQARAVAYGIEHFRSLMPRCMGAVVWQLNDIWPVISWSAVDGDGRLKPMWYALRRSFRDRLLTVQPRGPALALVAVNDNDEPWQTVIPIRRYAFDGTVLAATLVPLDVPGRTATTVPLPLEIARPDDPAAEVIVAGTGEDRAFWHFVEDIDAALPEPRFDGQAEKTAGGYRLTVTAQTLIRDLTVLADRVADDAQVDQALVTLLPGESVSFDIHTAVAVRPDAFVEPLVLRSANQLVCATVGPGIVNAGGEIW